MLAPVTPPLGGVGVEHPRRAVGQPGAVLEVTDGQFDHGVGAMVGVDGEVVNEGVSDGLCRS